MIDHHLRHRVRRRGLQRRQRERQHVAHRIQWNSFPGTFGFESVFSSLMPIANNDTATVNHGQSVTINVLANDQAVSGILDPATVQIASQPQHGTVQVNDNGTITYTSDTGSVLPRDSFPTPSAAVPVQSRTRPR